ncbi:MAG: zf-HC2 domain-containing protein [Bacteroidetes bacterium]|nr:zf-HC2 domain-containing protein [Bacteroidota bacterium]
MDDTNKKLCKEFESEMWLFIDHSMEKARKIFWQNHLVSCSDCSSLLKISLETIEQYNRVPLDDISDGSYKNIINAITADKRGNEHPVMPIKRNRSLFEIFGFYKLTFGGALVAAAIIFLIITFINEPKFPEIKKELSKQILAWNDKQMADRLEKVGDKIYSLQTNEWDIYFIRKNKKENWRKALSSIQKQIRKMQKEVASVSM